MTGIIYNRFISFTLSSLYVLLAVSPATYSNIEANKNGIEKKSWETTAHGVRLSLTQIQPGHVRGFYLARGFDTEAVESIAKHCVFQTVMRNVSAPGAIQFSLPDWRVLTPGGEHRLKLAPDWRQEWNRRGIPQPARLAFRWAQLPPRQSYEVGDWNMGMTMVALPLGSRFDLRFVWKSDSAKHEAMLAGVVCAMESSDDRN
jgi:hypothetical protein